MGSTSSNDTSYIATSAIHDLSVFKDNLAENTKSVDLSDEAIEELLKKDPDYKTMTEEDKESWRKTKRAANSVTNNVVVSDPFEYIVNGVINDKESGYTKVIDTSVPTLCFSFFNDKNALYNESTGYKYLEKLVEQNVFVSLIGDYDFSTYIGGYAYDLYQQTGGRQFSLRDSTSLYQRLVKYIYDKSESEEYPEIVYKYPMILSTGLEYVDLDEPITIDYLDAYKSVENYGRDSIVTSKYADTDDDELCDFEEINFDSDLIKVENGRIVIPTYEDCVNKFGDEYFYVQEGLDRFFESAPDYLPTADAHRVLYNTRVLPIRSDPTSGNADLDNYSDYQELVSLGTSPLRKNTNINYSELNYVIDTNTYQSEIFKDCYENDEFLQSYIWCGNHIFSANWSQVDLYKSSIISYFSEYVDQYAYYYETESLYDFEVNLYHKILEELTEAKSLIENSNIIDSSINEKKELLDNTYLAMKLYWEESHRTFYPQFETKEQYYNRIDDMRNMYDKISEKVPELEKNIYTESSLNKFIKSSKKETIVLSVFDAAFSAKEIIDEYIKVESNFSIFEENMYILDLLSSCADNNNMKKASEELKEYMAETYDNAIVVMSDTLKQIDYTLAYNTIKIFIAGLGSYGLIVVAIVDTYNILTNISEVSKYAEFAYSAAYLSHILNDDFQYYIKDSEFSQTGSYVFYTNSYDVQKKYLNLVSSRISAEQFYIEYTTKYAFYQEWMYWYDKNDAQINIDYLKTIIDHFNF